MNEMGNRKVAFFYEKITLQNEKMKKISAYFV